MSEQKLVLSAVKQKDFAGNNLCDWTIFYILREDIFADCLIFMLQEIREKFYGKKRQDFLCNNDTLSSPNKEHFSHTSTDKPRELLKLGFNKYYSPGNTVYNDPFEVNCVYFNDNFNQQLVLAALCQENAVASEVF